MLFPSLNEDRWLLLERLILFGVHRSVKKVLNKSPFPKKGHPFTPSAVVGLRSGLFCCVRLLSVSKGGSGPFLTKPQSERVNNILWFYTEKGPDRALASHTPPTHSIPFWVLVRRPLILLFWVGFALLVFHKIHLKLHLLYFRFSIYAIYVPLYVQDGLKSSLKSCEGA